MPCFDTCIAQNIKHDIWRRLDRHSIPLPIDRCKKYIRKEASHQLKRSFMILIGCHRKLYSLKLQRMKQIHDTRIRSTTIRIVLIIIRHKKRTNTLHIVLRTLLYGERTGEQFINTITHKLVVGLYRMCPISQIFQRSICCIGKISHGIKQRAIKIKYHQLFHSLFI